MSSYETRLQPTCGTNGDFYFNHLIVSEFELAELRVKYRDNLYDFAVAVNADFISVYRTGSLRFIHVTSEDNIPSIFAEGLRDLSGDYVNNLGKGIYVIREHDAVGVTSLLGFVDEFRLPNEKIAIVHGTYEGAYLECVYGDGHLGFIVLPTSVISSRALTSVEFVVVEDFLRNL